MSNLLSSVFKAIRMPLLAYNVVDIEVNTQFFQPDLFSPGFIRTIAEDLQRNLDLSDMKMGCQKQRGDLKAIFMFMQDRVQIMIKDVEKTYNHTFLKPIDLWKHTDTPVSDLTRILIDQFKNQNVTFGREDFARQAFEHIAIVYQEEIKARMRAGCLHPDGTEFAGFGIHP